MEKLNPDKQKLKKFGITMAAALSVIAGMLFLRHKPAALPYLFTASFAFFLLSLIVPGVLKPAYIVWMKLALGLSFINTRIILSAAFYLLFTPIGLVIRLLGIDPLERKIEKDRDSYWKKKQAVEFKPAEYERQF